MTDLAELASYATKRGGRTVDVKICDLGGRWRHLSMPARVFLDARSIGIGVDASNYGLAKTDKSDASLRFDTSHLFLDPFAGGPSSPGAGRERDGRQPATAWAVTEAAASQAGEVGLSPAAAPRFRQADPAISVIGQLARSDGEVLSDDPRGVAQRAEMHLASTGVADISMWLPELEFYVFQKQDAALNPFEVVHRISSADGLGRLDGGVAGSAYQSVPPLDRLHGLRARTASLLDEAGFPVKYHHHEVGAPGQIEIELELMSLVKAADSILLGKYLARNVAAENGLTANFMPKPLRGFPGNGMHVHIVLEKEGKGNVFAAESPGGRRKPGEVPGRGLLGPTGLQFIGGILLHADAVCAFANPSTNSYRRLSSGHEAPSSKTFGAQDRNAAIRIPAYAPDRFEYRPLDATANPYLALAALLMAGLDGVERGVNPDTVAGEASRLPATLDGSLAALERDHDFLLAGGVFTRSLLETWVAAKRRECEQLAEWPHPWEFVYYGTS